MAAAMEVGIHLRHIYLLRTSGQIIALNPCSCNWLLVCNISVLEIALENLPEQTAVVNTKKIKAESYPGTK